MIHFILLILKWIGWILLAILGLVVLLVCIALFVPLRYEVEGQCKDRLESAKGKVRFSFLLHLISGDVQFEDQKLKWKLRIAWKKLQSEDTASQEIEPLDLTEAGLKKESETGKTDAEEKIAEPVNVTELEKGVELETLTEPEKAVESETLTEPEKAAESTEVTEEQKTVTTKENTELDDKTAKQRAEKAKSETQKSKKTNDKKDSKQKKTLDQIIQELSKKYEEISIKVKSLIRKKDLVMKFLSSEVHQAAMKKLLSELKRLLLRLKPKNMRGRVDYGFEDPYWTGKTLAWASILYPFYAESLEINPYFDEKVIDVDVAIKGKISLGMFASFGLRLIMNKNIRLTIRHIKKLKTML